MDYLADVVSAINAFAPLIVSGLIVLVAFILERLWDFNSLRSKELLEQKKIWSQHVDKSITQLESIEVHLIRMHYQLKFNQNYDSISKIIDRIYEGTYTSLLQQPTEFLGFGHIIEFFEVVLYKFNNHCKTMVENKQVIPNENNKIWTIFHAIVKLEIALVNLVRLRLITGFLPLKSLGHTIIRSHLYEFMMDHLDKELSINDAKKQIIKDSIYAKLNTQLHNKIKQSIKEWMPLLEE